MPESESQPDRDGGGAFAGWGKEEQQQMAGIEVARGRGVYKVRQQGTSKATPVRAQELRLKGFKIAEIATALGTSTRTVQRYLRAS